jgi:hypothetical protein
VHWPIYLISGGCNSSVGRVDVRVDSRSVSDVSCCVVTITPRKYILLDIIASYIEYMMQYITFFILCPVLKLAVCCICRLAFAVLGEKLTFHLR